MPHILCRLRCAALLAILTLPGVCPADPTTEQVSVLAWRQERFSSLTSDDGWLTLAGLYWLEDGDNSFGSDPGNSLVLANPAVPGSVGTFSVSGGRVSFTAESGAGVMLDGQPVDSMNPVKLVSDAGSQPSVLACGPLRFFIIERGGKLGLRVRDLNSPRRLEFRGLEYFPVSSRWAINARFVPYQPARHIKIINILGMEVDEISPGAVAFSRNGRQWRLDTVLEDPGDRTLFIMFADTTNGTESYGAGRFLTIPMPVGNSALVDFNEAYNPPCAFNDFATCPLPPPQNRLQLRVDAGELKYAGGPQHAAQ